MNIFNFNPYKLFAKMQPPARWRYAILVVASIALLYGARLSLTSVFGRPSPQAHAVAALNESTEVLFLGTSHCQFGVNPSVFSRKTVVLAATFLDYVNMERIWKAHQSKVSGVKLVVLEVGIGALLRDITEANFDEQEVIDLEVYSAVPWYKKLADMRGTFRRFIRPLLIWRFSPKTLMEVRSEDRAGDILGAQWPGFQPSDETAKSAAVHNQALEKYKWIERQSDDEMRQLNRDAYTRLLQDLHKKNIKVVLLQFPLHPEALSATSDSWLVETQSMISLAREVLGKDLIVEAQPHGSMLEPEDFRDADHMNRQGALKFSRYLDEKLVRPHLD